MKCSHCGQEINNDSVSCEHCGKRVKMPIWVVLLIVLTLVLGVIVGVLISNNQNAQNNLPDPVLDTVAVDSSDNVVFPAVEETPMAQEQEVDYSSREQETAATPAAPPTNHKKQVEPEVIAASNTVSKPEKVVPNGYVDLGLPSGTLWKDKNESGFYDYDAALRSFGNKLPTKVQYEELFDKCKWTWTGSGYDVKGSNGNKIYLPAAGSRDCDGNVLGVGGDGYYWSSTPDDSDNAWDLYFYWAYHNMFDYTRCSGLSVRLVQGK